MSSLCGCFPSSSSPTPNDYLPLPMSPGSRAVQLPVDDNDLLLLVAGEAVNLILTDAGLSVVRRRTGSFGRAASSLRIMKARSSSTTIIPYLQVLSATHSSGASRTKDDSPKTHVLISAIASKPSSAKLGLWKLDGEVTGGKARAWCEELEKRAYGELKRRRRLRVLVNPFGGQGLAKRLWTRTVQPILQAAGCEIRVDYTGPDDHHTNATALARTFVLGEQDAVVCVSGDGVVHELLNGLASRPDALAALKLPIVPIPAGSGNALSVNCGGPSKANDLAWATLAIIKGTPTPLDLCSVTQNGKRTYSFLSQAFGLMADIDLGTEDWRWMGDARFTVGYIHGALSRREYPVELSIKVVESDKKAMAATFNASLQMPPIVLSDDIVDGGIPELRFGTYDTPLPEGTPSHAEIPSKLEPGWHTIKMSLLFVYAGTLPFVSKDAMLFPPSGRADGLIDLAIVGPSTRIEALLALDGAASGAVFRNPSTKYFKCEAFRLKPLSEKGYISIDGESIPHDAFQVEAHPQLARVLTLRGRFFGEPISI